MWAPGPGSGTGDDVLEGIPLALLGEGASWALNAFFVWLVYTGRMVPRRFYDEALKGLALWQATHEEDQEQLSAAIKVLRTFEAFMRAFPGYPKPSKGTFEPSDGGLGEGSVKGPGDGTEGPQSWGERQ